MQAKIADMYTML